VAGQNVSLNSTTNIKWNASAFGKNAKINISIVSIINPNDIIPIAKDISASSGSFSWNVSKKLSTGAYRIQIYNSTKTLESGIFNIVPQKSIIVIMPNGGEKWQRGRTYNIMWSMRYFTTDDKVGITINNTSIAANIPANKGLYAWKVPADFALGNKYKIGVYYDSSIYDKSDDNFSITAQGTLLDSIKTQFMSVIGAIGNLFVNNK
jgi:hypothetical protein